MASLDEMEGDLIELVGIILLVIIIWLAYLIWKASPTGGWWQSLVTAVQELGRGVTQGLTNPEQAYTGSFQNPLTPETLSTGTSSGNWGDGIVGPDPNSAYALPDTFYDG